MKWFACFAVVFAVLSGCASVPKPDNGMQPGMGGYVYLSYPKNIPGTPVVVQALDGGKIYALNPILDQATAATGAWLPAGDYKISEWGGLPFGNYTPFHVVKGHVTDLGSLVPFDIGGYQIVVLPLRPQELKGDIQLVIKRYRQWLVSDEPIEWIPSKLPSPINLPQAQTPLQLGAFVALLNEYAQYRNRPPLQKQLVDAPSIQSFFDDVLQSSQPVTRIPVVGSDGSYYYGALYGQIRVRDIKGKWSTIDTHTLHDITTIAMHDQLMVAGYDDGEIRTSADNGKTWQQVINLDCKGAVLGVEWTGSRWLVFAVVQTMASNGVDYASKVVVYASDGNALNHLAKIDSASLPLKSAVGVSFLRLESIDGNYFINAVPDLMRLDAKTLQWTRLPVPGVISTYSISKPDGTIAAFFGKGMFSKLYVSLDKGNAWKQYTRPPYSIMDVVFNGAQRGTEVRIKSKMFTVAVQIYVYDSQSDQWQQKTEAPVVCNRVFDNADGAPEFCVTKGGTILRYQHDKWAVEYSSE